MHLNTNSLLPKIDELRHLARLSNAAVIGICKSKLDKSITNSEILIDNYDLLRCDRNRNGGGVACYIRNDLSYMQKNLFPNDIENVFFEIHLPRTKLITLELFTDLRMKLISLKLSIKILRNLIQLIKKLKLLEIST